MFLRKVTPGRFQVSFGLILLPSQRQHAKAEIAMGGIFGIELRRFAKVGRSLLKAGKDALHIVGSPRQKDLFQLAELSLNKPQVGIQHRPDIVIPLVLQNIFQIFLCKNMIALLTQTVRHAAVGIEI